MAFSVFVYFFVFFSRRFCVNFVAFYSHLQLGGQTDEGLVVDVLGHGLRRHGLEAEVHERAHERGVVGARATRSHVHDRAVEALVGALQQADEAATRIITGVLDSRLLAAVVHVRLVQVDDERLAARGALDHVAEPLAAEARRHFGRELDRLRLVDRRRRRGDGRVDVAARLVGVAVLVVLIGRGGRRVVDGGAVVRLVSTALQVLVFHPWHSSLCLMCHCVKQCGNHRPCTETDEQLSCHRLVPTGTFGTELPSHSTQKLLTQVIRFHHSAHVPPFNAADGQLFTAQIIAGRVSTPAHVSCRTLFFITQRHWLCSQDTQLVPLSYSAQC